VWLVHSLPTPTMLSDNDAFRKLVKTGFGQLATGYRKNPVLTALFDIEARFFAVFSMVCEFIFAFCL